MASDQTIPDTAGSAAFAVSVLNPKTAKSKVTSKFTTLTHRVPMTAPSKNATIKQEPGIKNVSIEQEATEPQEPSTKKTVIKAKSTVVVKRSSVPSGRGGKGGQKGVLNTLAKLQKHQQVTDAPRKQVATLTGMKITSLNVLLCHMKKKGLVECPSGDTVRLTESGKNMSDVDDSTPLPTTAAVHDDIKKNVLKGGRMLEIFDHLSDGKTHKKAHLMNAIRYTNKNSFSVLMSQMKSSTGVLEYPDQQSVRLTDMCFPFGRPS